MSPMLGEKLQACMELRAENEGLNDFEQLLGFSAGSIEKWMKTYDSSVQGVLRHKAFMENLVTLVGRDVEKAKIAEQTTEYSNVRVIDIGGICLTETTFVNANSEVTEISYEAWQAEQDSIVTTNPSVEA